MIGRVISHFEVLEQIGKGGMGVVYKCRDLELDRLVAIKFLVDEVGDTDDAVDRFKREARAASSLDHPNICTIHEIGRTDDGHLFIVMAYYDGDTLRRRMDDDLTVDETIELATQIASGLAAAHKQGIAHRDIKPGNVVITESGRAVIVDFGLATLPGFLALTKTGSTLGTAAYMAPEQLSGGSADARSDVWSFGVVLYEMVTGKRPFVGEYEQAISYAIVNQDPDPITGLEKDPQSLQLQTIINRCLSKDPAARYRDAGEVVADLESLAPAAVRPIEPKETGSKQTSRLVGVGLTLSAIVLIVIAFALGWNPLSQTSSQVGQAEDIVGATNVVVPKLLILPFENLGNAEDAFFATGVSDEINGRLSTIRSLSVISRRSAERYAETEMTTREIGDELGVDYILEGQVRWARQEDGQSQVRISPMLIRVADDTQLWADSYDRRIEDIFEIQADVAMQVAIELDARLSESDRDLLEQAPTDNVAAYQEFLKGTALFAEQELEEAAKSFENALELDPNFVRASYLLARTYSWLYFIQRHLRSADPDLLESRARAAMESAVALAPESAEAHLAAGYYYYYVGEDRTRAREEFEVAISMRPGDADAHAALGYLLRRIGAFRESAAQMHRALEVDPNNLTVLREAARTHGHIREYRIVDSLLTRAIKLAPLEERLYCMAGHNLFDWKGVTDEVVQRFESRPVLPNRLSPCIPTVVDLARRDFDKILAQLDAIDETVLQPSEKMQVESIRGAIARYAGNREAEEEAISTVEGHVEQQATERGDRASLVALNWLRAAQGDREAALRLDEEIFELDKDDQLLQLVSTMRRAEIMTMIGYKDEAVEIIRADLEADAGMFNRHNLMLPAWDPLRDEPEFQSLLNP